MTAVSPATFHPETGNFWLVHIDDTKYASEWKTRLDCSIMFIGLDPFPPHNVALGGHSVVRAAMQKTRKVEQSLMSTEKILADIALIQKPQTPPLQKHWQHWCISTLWRTGVTRCMLSSIEGRQWLLCTISGEIHVPSGDGHPNRYNVQNMPGNM